ncbi:hydroxyethylthiazole kinase [Vibrio gangliei]|uniref:hydroxyethylthiazole kinase n=1 Tax=Vibrio gangliei TaxID=2077090 RepID=UPI000D0172C4|nr:hydroxyethylthiazole kinase [Vibrio gangliei]
MHQLISEKLQQLRERSPLVLNITNYVVMNNTANALLAVGASPIMAHSREEMEDMVKIAHCLVINIGTLDRIWVERMRFAIKQANIFGKPVILDPVGCGASKMRTAVSQEFCQLADKLIIRANASEVMALADLQSHVKGVDALDTSDSAIIAAQKVIKQYGVEQVVISGEQDFVVSDNTIYRLDNGHDLMPKITGMGCTHTALTGAFASIDFASAGLCATAVLGIAGELAGKQAQGPGSLQMHILDKLHGVDAQAIEYTLECGKYDPE